MKQNIQKFGELLVAAFMGATTSKLIETANASSWQWWLYSFTMFIMWIVMFWAFVVFPQKKREGV
jgi:hypothetical protein